MYGSVGYLVWACRHTPAACLQRLHNPVLNEALLTCLVENENVGCVARGDADGALVSTTHIVSAHEQGLQHDGLMRSQLEAEASFHIWPLSCEWPTPTSDNHLTCLIGLVLLLWFQACC